MKRNKTYITLVGTLLIVMSLWGCQKDRLDVENLNQPDRDRVMANPNDLLGIAAGLYQEWFSLGHSSSNGPAMPLLVMSDHQTCSWGNFGMRDLSSEPRAAWNNSPTYDNKANFQNFVESRMSVISQVNDIFSQVIVKGIKIGENGKDNDMVLAWGYFARAISYGQIAMVFDKSIVVTETDISSVELKSYKDVLAQAISDFDNALTFCNSTFTTPSVWFAGKELTNTELKSMINAYAARYMVLSSRNKLENDANDWAKIKTYAENGLDFDVSIMTDANLWYSSYIGQSHSPTWLHTDMRIINLMDPNYPKRYSLDGTPPSPKFATTADARLATYFKKVESCGFRPERGYYHFSHYKYSVYSYTYDNWLNGLVYDYKQTENDLYLAEALLRTGGSKATVVSLINKTRVNNGDLPDLTGTESDTELFDAIFYERALEIVYTGVGIEFCDMRRRDMLQTGTPLHFPVPGAHLETLGLPVYTYGGVANADGVNTSNAGWE